MKNETRLRPGGSELYPAGFNAQFLLCVHNTAWAAWILLLLLVGLPETLQAQFTYAKHNGTITIVEYSGSGGPVTIPSAITGLPVTEIGGDVFQGQDQVTSVFIPKSVTQILAPSTFSNCSALTNVTVDTENPFYSSRDGVLFNKSQDNLITYPANKRGDYIVPNSVTNIVEAAFRGCAGLTSVILPGGVTQVGYFEFSGCTGLQNLTLPSNVTSIGSFAYGNCTGLRNVTIPDTVTNISAGAFRSCTNLTQVTIGKSVAHIGFSPRLEWAFEGCTSLTNYAVDPLNLSYSSREGTLFNKAQDKLIAYPSEKGGECIVPDSVTEIGPGAFSRCARLTRATIPSSVTEIGTEAFSYCSRLQSVTIPIGVSRIESGTFQACTGLTNITIGHGVIDIGGRAFFGCSDLTSVTIPSSVASIDFDALGDCAALRSLFFSGNVPPFINQPVISGATHPTVYYLPGSTGWGSTFSGRLAILWNPVLQVGDDPFGVGGQGFRYNIKGATNIPIVVDASTNLASGAWVPLQTLRLTNGLISFSDSESTHHPNRFYRIRSP